MVAERSGSSTRWPLWSLPAHLNRRGSFTCVTRFHRDSGDSRAIVGGSDSLGLTGDRI
jgi:hypothetical protein